MHTPCNWEFDYIATQSGTLMLTLLWRRSMHCGYIMCSSMYVTELAQSASAVTCACNEYLIKGNHAILITGYLAIGYNRAQIQWVHILVILLLGS